MTRKTLKPVHLLAGAGAIILPAGCSEDVKPNIVFFGENLLYMDKVDDLLRHCDMFLSVGTSGVVFPAAAFVQVR